MRVIDESIWTTKHGEEIEISEMSNTHLKNSIKYLERVFEKTVNNLKFINDHIANDSISRRLKKIVRDLKKLGPVAMNSAYDDLVKELNKRKQKTLDRNTYKSLYILLVK